MQEASEHPCTNYWLGYRHRHHILEGTNYCNYISGLNCWPVVTAIKHEHKLNIT